MTTTYTNTASASADAQVYGQVVGTPQLLLRMEGGAMLTAAAVAYSAVGQGWGLFAILFLVPDMSILGYLAGRRVGATVYNFGHSYLAPAGLCALGYATSITLILAIGFIWLAHIGFDRAMGYGLKYPIAFKHTHLGLLFSKRAGDK